MLGLLLIGGFALYTLDRALISERKAGIDTLLRLAARDIEHYQQLEQSGRLDRAQAQTQALDALRALRDGDDYLFVRRMDGYVLLHADKRKEGHIDDAGKMADGRSGMQGYLDALANADSGFIELMVRKPGQDNFVSKINGIRHIAGWDWIVGYGAYTDDIDHLFWQQALLFMILGAVIVLLVIALSTHQARHIYRRLGGEPDAAAAAAAAIAAGSLNGIIAKRKNAGDDSLLGSMVAMQQELRAMVREIGQEATTLHNDAGDISTQMEQISDATKQSSQATASTAAAVEQLSVSIRQIADHAGDTERQAEQTSQLSETGMQQVLAVADEMHRVAEEINDAGARIGTLSARTQEIDGIANVIKEIADQTNLLALNAAIEAARAGEQGRGFAVVADEVRKLAERTGGATEQIAQMIHAIQADTSAVVARMEAVGPRVNASVGQAHAAAEGLRHIREGAAAAQLQTREVAHSTAEQSAANANLASNVEQISLMVENAARSADATNVKVRELKALSARLGTLIGRFRLD